MLKPRTPSPSPVAVEAPLKTPQSLRAVRRELKALRKAGKLADEDVDRLGRAVQKLALDNEVLRHTNAGLQESLITEQKR